MSKFNELEVELLRLLSIRNTLQILLELPATTEHNLTNSIVNRYAILELANFIKYQESLMGKLTKQQKKFVICLNPFLEELITNRVALKKIRDGWVAHIQDDDEFKEDIMELMKRLDFPKYSYDVIVMAKCVIYFVDGLKIIIAKEFYDANEKSNELREDSFQWLFTSEKLIKQITEQRLELVRYKLKLEGFPSPY